MKGKVARLNFHLLLLSLVLLLLYTGIGYTQAEYTDSNVITLSYLSAPENLNPILSSDTAANDIAALLFNGLFRLNEQGEPVPDLAESWKISEDKLTWTFRLRQGVKFHDGVELTSEDVLFTYNAIIDPVNQSPYAGIQNMVSRFETDGRYGFRVFLYEPYAPLYLHLRREILPSHLFSEKNMTTSSYNRHPIGTGPYAFSSWTDRQIELTAYDNYFDGRPRVDRVILKGFPDREGAWSALMQGQVDVVEDLNYDDFRILQADPRFTVYQYLGAFYYTLLFNHEDPLFKNSEMRTAVDLAINREDLIAKALQDWGVPTTGPFRPETWPYNPDVELVYDPGRAISILDRLGWHDTNSDLIREKDGRDLTIHILINQGDSAIEQVAKRIRWQLLQVGIRMDVTVIDQRELFTNHLFPGEFQTALLQFNALGDPDYTVSNFWHSRNIGRTNLARYRNREVDILIEEGIQKTHIDERAPIYRRIHALMAEDRAAVFLFFRKKFLATSSRFAGVKASPENYYTSMPYWSISIK